jgi:hypothetical protein
MTIAGEGRAPARSHFLKLADLAGISGREAQTVIEDVVAAVVGWRSQAKRAGVGTRATKVIEKALQECLARI